MIKQPFQVAHCSNTFFYTTNTEIAFYRLQLPITELDARYIYIHTEGLVLFESGRKVVFIRLHVKAYMCDEVTAINFYTLACYILLQLE